MLKIQQQTAPQLEEEKKLPAMTTSTSRQNIHRSISFSTHVPFVQFVPAVCAWKNQIILAI
jgi:hypothetical protein